MNNEKGFPWMPVLIGVGCLSILCLCVLVVGGGAAYYSFQKTGLPGIFEPNATATSEATLEIATPEIIEDFSPTEESFKPLATEPSESAPLTGQQSVDEDYLFDDFSSDAMGWPVFD
ncbi:MAG: hypothetical protein LWX83_17580, partial [Anaerolineae bacterium]|nr:hypothetical protein [Anaerolineae bacterium]